ncbi:zinc finger protein Xfin isoform X1 [Folsomia candida]|uniref:zinc finger protein Xfin isoform X1 n=2 Tax=Folsomia candida TaxID=158441 RepID=UPI001604BD40|nr:zinc finger protein Xfin isoform X1 [Folsomia candida]
MHRGVSEADIAAALKTAQRKRLVPQKRPFPCPKCDQSFASPFGLRQHNRSSHDWVPYRRKCTLCPKVFTKLTLLQRHMHKAHNAPIPRQETRHSCAMCSKTMTTFASKQCHVEQFHFPDKTSCPYGCEAKIDSEADWVTHLEGCDSPKISDESECACKYCPAVFRSILLEMEHHLRAHPENTYSCPTCAQRFTRQSVLRVHRCPKNADTEVRNFARPDVAPVSICVASPHVSEFPPKVAPADEQISNNGDAQQLTGCLAEEVEEFPVKVEPDDETRSDPLYDPPEMSQSESESDAEVANSQFAKFESNHVCKICKPNVTFATRATLRRHMRNKKFHREVDIVEDQRISAGKKFACKFCNIKFARNHGLLRHLRNKKIHPDLSEVDGSAPELENSQGDTEATNHVCKMCLPNVPFTSRVAYGRYLSNKNIHPGLSDEDIAAALTKDKRRIPRGVPLKQNLFQCPACDNRFFSKSRLALHRRHVHDWTPFRRKCPHCSKTFVDLHALQRHLHKSHDVPSIPRKKTRHSCDLCAATFTTWGSRDRHVELAHFPDKTSCPYGCEVKIDSSEATWVTHLEGCESPKMSTESEWVCKYCPAVFRSVLLHIAHRLRVHPENTLSCSTCAQIFTSKAVLDNHHCAILGNSAAPKKSEKSGAKFMCKICQPNVTFTTSKIHMRHMRNKNIHQDIAAAHVAEVESRLQSGTKFECKKCGVKFTHISTLYKHMRNNNMHPDIPKISGSTGSTRRDATNQQAIHCPKCDQSFSSQFGLRQHMGQIHAGITRKCPHCPRQFTHLALLQKHTQQWHKVPWTNTNSSRERHSCDMCEKTFAKKYGLIWHVELVHLPDKTSCPYGCEAKIDSAADWVTHLEGCESPKMISESENFCQFCDAVFRNTLLRMEHHLRQHPDNSCFCPVCRTGFTCQSALYKHLNNCKISSSNSL